jgi:pimeloyl-ACP methyl ester carboxylesterase
MKHLLRYFTWLFFGIQSVLAQDAERVSSSGFVQQSILVQSYAGLPYRVSLRARIDTSRATGATANVLALIADKKKTIAAKALSGTAASPIRSPEWHSYSLGGKLPAKAEYLVLRLVYHLNGRVGFDDVKVEVQQKGQWQTLTIQSADFESPSAAGQTLPPGWRVPVPIAGFAPQVAQESSGNHYLAVQGQHVIAYGRNPAAGHYCTANGVKLYYETYGQGSPLLLLHGNGESISSFSNQIATFAREYHVIAVDTRDHGKSATTHGKLTYDLLADDMNALLDSLKLPAAHIVGWSDGGNTGLSMALRYPGRVKSLVTMGANLYADTTAVDVKMLKEVRQMYHLTSVLGPFNAKMRNAHRLTAMLLHYPQLQPSQLTAIQRPVLVLAGEKDIIKASHTRLIGQSIPHARVVLLTGVTHYAPQENPGLFNETVLAFLKNATNQ